MSVNMVAVSVMLACFIGGFDADSVLASSTYVGLLSHFVLEALGSDDFPRPSNK